MRIRAEDVVFCAAFVLAAAWIGSITYLCAQEVADWNQFRRQCEQAGGTAVQQRDTGNHVCLRPSQILKQDYPEAP